jgi:hypothetical protein
MSKYYLMCYCVGCIANIILFIHSKQWVFSTHLENFMKKLFVTLSLCMSFAFAPFALANQAACEAKAVSKDGKPLYGAAKDASIKKCMGSAKDLGCEAKAVSKDGKPLYGAAKAASIKKCEGGA